MPIRAAILNPDQMAEYLKTGKLPADARVAAYDDRGCSLTGGPALDSRLFTSAPGNNNADPDDWLYRATGPEGEIVAIRASKLAMSAVDSEDRARFKIMAEQLLYRTGIGHTPEQFIASLVGAFEESFRTGYTCGVGDVLIGKIPMKEPI